MKKNPVNLKRVGKLMSCWFNPMSWELSWNQIKRVELSRFQTLFSLKWVELSTQNFKKKELSGVWLVIHIMFEELSSSMLSHEEIELSWVIEKNISIELSWIDVSKNIWCELNWIELAEHLECRRVELNSTHIIQKNWIESNSKT